MEWFLLWLVFAVVVGVIAASRGKSGFGWFLLSCLISPLLGLILVLALGPPAGALAAPAGADAPTPETHVRCPDCRELVRYDAVKCKHCGAALVPQEAPAPVVRASSSPEQRARRQAAGMVVLRSFAVVAGIYGAVNLVGSGTEGPVVAVACLIFAGVFWWIGGKANS
jgi:hypothetical protein